ncbi:MAG: phosphate ABC transporter substrate-binding protein [Chloroflexales bacterium]|nr:phosphate ABC transporter substrate-binding protein [Chloroflexales bacterium]
MNRQLRPLLLILAALVGACGAPPATSTVSTPRAPASSSPTPLAGHITFAGSTTMQPLVEKLAAVYRGRNPQVELEIAAGGSVVGINAVTDGSADIGMASRELKPGERAPTTQRFVIAIDVLAVIVHHDNPVRQLSLEQLRRIYTGAVRNWQELGGSDTPILPVIRETSSGTRGAFDELVLNGDALTAAAEARVTAGEVQERVASDAAAIGYVGFGNVNTGEVVVVAIDTIVPTPETAQDGSYPLTRPLLLLTGPLSRPLARSFIDFVLSDEGQRLVAADGWVPVPR